MSELRAGEWIGGRYRLLERLGVGGMGEVWLAEYQGAGAFRRRVVIKALAPGRRGDDRLAAMLADEARVVGLLHHPGIVSALDYVETDEHGPIFVIEWVDGISLRALLIAARKTGMVMPEGLAVYIGIRVAHALQAAHAALGYDGQPLHVVHRDVAPDNVLLSRLGAVYLGDFGVARAAGNSDVTSPGAGPKGKRGYMSPEQAAGQPVGPAADIFSLGRMVAEAADVACGPELRAVIERATAENPRNRHATASELAEALAVAVQVPPDPQMALSRFLHAAAAEVLANAHTSPGTTPVRSDPPPAGRPAPEIALHPALPEQKLFPAVPPPRPAWLRPVAIGGVFAAVLLPLAVLQHERHLFSRGASAFEVPRGQLRVVSRPAQAEVYVDGQLRGGTPLQLTLAVGKHSLRVGSPRLEHWRAVDVFVKENVDHVLDIDLTE